MKTQGNYDNAFTATMKGISDLLFKKNRGEAVPEDLKVKGKTVLITGASSGLGFATAKQLSVAGADLLMAVRSGIPEKGEQIEMMSGNKVTMLHLDLADFSMIDEFLNNLESLKKPIDIFINNAAVVALEARKTSQGLDEMFAVNYLAPFYLINQLVQRNLLAPEAKMIIVSSESHRNPKAFEWEKFGLFETFGFNETVSKYGYYKLLLTTFAVELSRQVNYKVRVLCPGPVNSNIAREAPALLKPVLSAVFGLFFRSPEKATAPIRYFVADDSAVPLDYMFLTERKEIDQKALEPSDGERLWLESAALLEKIGFPIR
jgi:NAD(P)-dependent dehydrogenase (short-subunit alcohol dehydrogenase family)